MSSADDRTGPPIGHAERGRDCTSSDPISDRGGLLVKELPVLFETRQSLSSRSPVRCLRLGILLASDTGSWPTQYCVLRTDTSGPWTHIRSTRPQASVGPGCFRTTQRLQAWPLLIDASFRPTISLYTTHQGSTQEKPAALNCPTAAATNEGIANSTFQRRTSSQKPSILHHSPHTHQAETTACDWLAGIGQPLTHICWCRAPDFTLRLANPDAA